MNVLKCSVPNATRAAALAAALVCTANAQDPNPKPNPIPKAQTAPNPPMPPRPPKITMMERDRGDRDRGKSDRSYDQGTRALDAGRWDDARQIFDAIAGAKGSRADGALYWRAYAENRLGRRDEALATLASLRQQYPSSDWLNDAQALAAEIQQQGGKPLDPNAQANEELKLLAIKGIADSDPERAVPLLEKLLKSPGTSPRLKDNALFVLTQTRSPQAQQLLISIAKTGSNPDLQLRALRYMAQLGNKNIAPDIAAIYNSSHNQAIKRQALNSLFMAKGADELFNIAKTEQDAGLREEAIRDLGMMRQSDKLQQLYQGGVAKKTVLESMFMLGDPTKVLEIARAEKDPELRATAIRSLGMMHSAQVGEGLIALYSNEQDMNVKKSIVEAIWMQHNAKGLVDIARKESNPEMKRDIVQKLTMMKSKEGTDYLMELLK
jgi:HEAT repeat protein